MTTEKIPPNTQGAMEMKKDVTKDEAVLASLGYKQEFKREFSRLEIFGIGFSIVGVVPSITCVGFLSLSLQSLSSSLSS